MMQHCAMNAWMLSESSLKSSTSRSEAEVLGIPVRIEVGERDLKENKITFVRRDTNEKYTVDKDIDILNYTYNLLEKIQTNLFNKAKERLESLTYEAHTLKEVEDIMNTKPGFVKAMWCGDEACELKMKEIKGTKSRCIVETKDYEDEICVVCGKKAKHKVVWGIQY